jgi:hypothetical protein
MQHQWGLTRDGACHCLLVQVEALLDRHAGDPPVMQVGGWPGGCCEVENPLVLPVQAACVDFCLMNGCLLTPPSAVLAAPCHCTAVLLQYCTQKLIELGYRSWAYRVVNSAGGPACPSCVCICCCRCVD